MVCSTVKAEWWSLLMVLMVFGGLGGASRHLMDQHLRNGARSARGWLGPCFLGAVAGLVVPLFLNASSSSLVQSILDGGEHADRDWFFLVGYSVLAGLVGNMFLSSMAARSLKLSQEANDLSHAAKKVADVVQQQSRDLNDRVSNVVNEQIPQATRRTRDLIRPLALIDDEKYEEAITDLQETVQEDPHHAEAYAWLAYCFKHRDVPDIDAAIGAVQTALDNETPQPSAWLYNLACYKALKGEPEADVMSVLEKAYQSATEQQKRILAADLTDDKDFEILRARNHDSAFWRFVRKIKRSI